MKTKVTGRGFIVIEHPTYLKQEPVRLIGESSAVGNYDDSWDNPGSSYLWFGDDIHLNREEVSDLIKKLAYWLENKRLPSE